MVGSVWLSALHHEGGVLAAVRMSKEYVFLKAIQKKFIGGKYSFEAWLFLPIRAGCTNSVSVEQACQTRSVTRATLRNENIEGVTTQEVATKTVLLLWSFLSVQSEWREHTLSGADGGGKDTRGIAF
jgi:hypothetical protein